MRQRTRLMTPADVINMDAVTRTITKIVVVESADRPRASERGTTSPPRIAIAATTVSVWPVGGRRQATARCRRSGPVYGRAVDAMSHLPVWVEDSACRARVNARSCGDK